MTCLYIDTASGQFCGEPAAVRASGIRCTEHDEDIEPIELTHAVCPSCAGDGCSTCEDGLVRVTA